MQTRRLTDRTDTKLADALRLNEVETVIAMDRLRALLALAKGRVAA